MITNKPPADDLLDRAADLRAAGKKWEAIAVELGRSPQTVRKWPIKYPTRWRKGHGLAELRGAEPQDSLARGGCVAPVKCSDRFGLAYKSSRRATLPT